MAKDLSVQTGVQPDANFLNGKLVDNITLVGEGVNQDIIQFFQKLMDLASITPNGNSDNEANGYQFISALLDYILNIFNITYRNIVTGGVYTLLDTENYVNINASSLGATTINLPAVSSVNKGTTIVFKISVGDLTGALVIAGIKTYAINGLGVNAYLVIKSDGVSWDNIITETANPEESSIATTNRTLLLGATLKTVLDGLSSDLTFKWGTSDLSITTDGTYSMTNTTRFVNVNISSSSNPLTRINTPTTSSSIFYGVIRTIKVNQVSTGAHGFDIYSGAINLISITSSIASTISGVATIGYKGSGEWYLISSDIAAI